MTDPVQQDIANLVSSANRILLGKEDKIKLAITSLISNGHLLINDLPGVGKTTLANLLARLFGLQFQRIQFTSDLLPADITGVSIFNRTSNKFEFHPGPVFAQLVLADEINRATPKTQSALLEAMEERQVTVDGRTRKLDEPFFVIATQNPAEQAGTFPLPESQLDRFLLSIELGYPDRRSERAMLSNSDPRQFLESVNTEIHQDKLITLQGSTERVHCSDALLDYVQAIIDHSRTSPRFVNGYSPRAAMGIVRASKSWAFIHGRDAVVPEDVQAIVPATLHHLRANGGKINAIEDILSQIAIP